VCSKTKNGNAYDLQVEAGRTLQQPAEEEVEIKSNIANKSNRIGVEDRIRNSQILKLSSNPGICAIETSKHLVFLLISAQTPELVRILKLFRMSSRSSF